MRPYESDYEELDDLDDFGYPDNRAVRHMTNERQRDELRLRSRRRSRSYGKDRWQDDEWSDYDDDFDDYSSDDFDAYYGLNFDQH